MIEIKKRWISDLEVGEKFSHGGMTCVKVQDGYVIDHNIHNDDNKILPCPVCFGSIELWELFVYGDKLYEKYSIFTGKEVGSDESVTFPDKCRVFKVKKLVVLL